MITASVELQPIKFKKRANYTKQITGFSNYSKIKIFTKIKQDLKQYQTYLRTDMSLVIMTKIFSKNLNDL